MFNCAICRNDKEGKKFIYASSTREVKLLVCSECHKAKLEAAQKKADEFGLTLGVLKFKEEK